MSTAESPSGLDGCSHTPEGRRNVEHVYGTEIAFFGDWTRAGTEHERGLDTSGDGTLAGDNNSTHWLGLDTGGDWTGRGLDTSGDWTLEF